MCSDSGPLPSLPAQALFLSFTHSKFQTHTYLPLRKINDAFSGLCITSAWKTLSPPPLPNKFHHTSGLSSEIVHSGFLQVNFPSPRSPSTFPYTSPSTTLITLERGHLIDSLYWTVSSMKANPQCYAQCICVEWMNGHYILYADKTL